jgi:23S rRNA pseudouridine1911/1915/1917 synthase
MRHEDAPLEEPFEFSEDPYLSDEDYEDDDFDDEADLEPLEEGDEDIE